MGGHIVPNRRDETVRLKIRDIVPGCALLNITVSQKLTGNVVLRTNLPPHLPRLWFAGF